MGLLILHILYQCLCALYIGHLDVIDEAKNGLKEKGWDNVILGGNYAYGVALGKCIEFGY